VIPINEGTDWRLAPTPPPPVLVDRDGVRYTNQPVIDSLVPTCRFWNVTRSEWSSDGCALVERTDTHMVCACTHLTSFQAAQLQPPFRPMDIQVWQSSSHFVCMLVLLDVL
jgi:hypothetical protein